ncbi:hypothetical protein O4H61_04615 [Roseovarius aestuarii]|nr:hypothetical protein [Roseovarius aestuarii]
MYRLNSRSHLSHADFFLLGLAYASLIFTIAYDVTGLKSEFSAGFAIEDGPVEWGTAVCLALAAVVLFRNSGALWSKSGKAAALITAFYGVIYIFGAGEEISWGQRIFGLESGDFFSEHNFQNEITAHNLVVGDKQLTKTLFGPALTLVLLLYLVVLPLLHPRIVWMQTFAHSLSVPVPGKRHVLLTILASLVMLAVNMDRKWEVYEFVFALLSLSIFLSPANTDEVT